MQQATTRLALASTLTILACGSPHESATPHHHRAARAVAGATVRLFAFKGVGFEAASNGSALRLADIQLSLGSGVVVDRAGLVLTARHVVMDSKLVVVLPPGSDASFPARMVYVDPDQDLAFVRTPASFPVAIAMPSAEPELTPGETLLLAGFPLDPHERAPAMLSAQLSRVTNEGLLQLGSNINHGNSGGPVVDEDDRLVGIVSARLEHGAQGIGFAVPLDTAIAAYPAAHTTTYTGGQAVRDARAAELVTTVVRGLSRRSRAEMMDVRDSMFAQMRTAPDAMTIALAAAFTWNLVALSMIQRHYAHLADVPEAQRGQFVGAIDAVRLACRRAVETDPDNAQLYPFLGAVAALPEGAAAFSRPVVAAAPVAEARPLAIGTTVHGRLERGDTALRNEGVGDDYALRLSAGQTVTVVTRGIARHGSPSQRLDVLTVLLHEHTTLALGDDSAGDGNSRILFIAPHAGSYIVRVASHGPGLHEGDYSLSVYAGSHPTQR